MSIKTLRKRIALVAVSALGVGLLSVAPASSATSAVDAETFDFTRTGSVGICLPKSDATLSTAINTGTDATQVGEVISGGSIGFTRTSDDELDASTSDYVTISLSGPAKFNSVTPEGTTPGVVTYPSATSLRVTGDTSKVKLPSAFVVGSTGTGVIQITITKVDSGTGSDVEIYTFTSVASCASGVANVSNSFVKVSYYSNSASASVPSSNVTDSTAAVTTAGSASLAESADKIANGGKAYIDVRIMDGAPTPAIVTTAGVFGASATNGAVVSWDTSDSLQASSASEAVAAGNQFNRLTVWQGTANANKPMSTVVTITYNGVEYGKRTISWTGKATKISILPAYSSIGKAGVTAKYALAYAITDSAGNDLTGTGPGITGASSSGETNSPLRATSDVILDATQGVVTDAAAVINTEASGYVGTTDVACGTRGKADVQLKYVFSDLSSIVSNTYSFACASAPVNYKASLDKASYQPGEVATLTITATDVSGNPVYDLDATPAGNDLGSTASPVSISLPQMTAVTAATNSDEFSGGKKTYKFTVGSTEGTFTGVVDLPLYNSTTYAQAAQTITYKVASATSSVTNAEVLAAIVKLIASINKQIRALQKQLRR